MKIIKLFQLIYYYFIDLLQSNMQVAYDIITPGEIGDPHVIKIELEAKKDVQIFILTCLVTMTPGSLCLKISEDRHFLWIHYLYPDSVDGLVDTVKNKYEKLVMEIF
jgi:multicomponent Na+:H+ antiporter subunit E